MPAEIPDRTSRGEACPPGQVVHGHGLVVAELDRGDSARAEEPAGRGKHAPGCREPARASGEREAGIVAGHFGREPIHDLVRDIGRVRHDDVEGAGERGVPIAHAKGRPVFYPVQPGIVPGRPGRLRAPVQPHSGEGRPPVEQRHEDASRSRAEIEYGERRPPVRPGRQHGIDQRLGVRPGHEGRGFEPERQAVELCLAQDAGDRLPREASRREIRQPGCALRSDRERILRKEPRGGKPEGRRREQAGIERRVVEPRRPEGGPQGRDGRVARHRGVEDDGRHGVPDTASRPGRLQGPMTPGRTTHPVPTTILSLDGAAPRQDPREVAVEAAIEVSYGGVPFAVMMLTPADLVDFAYGFSMTEGIVAAASDVRNVDVTARENGVSLAIGIAPDRMHALLARRRSMAGRTGCGVCGIEDLAALERASPPPDGRPEAPPVPLAAIGRALAALPEAQVLGRLTGATHAAAFADGAGRLLHVREDVGRHNALDKLVGATLRDGLDAASGFVVVTSRCSFEMVEKAATLGARIVVAISAPTTLAIARAKALDVTLVAIARRDTVTVFGGQERIVG